MSFLKIKDANFHKIHTYEFLEEMFHLKNFSNPNVGLIKYFSRRNTHQATCLCFTIFFLNQSYVCELSNDRRRTRASPELTQRITLLLSPFCSSVLFSFPSIHSVLLRPLPTISIFLAPTQLIVAHGIVEARPASFAILQYAQSTVHHRNL